MNSQRFLQQSALLLVGAGLGWMGARLVDKSDATAPAAERAAAALTPAPPEQSQRASVLPPRLAQRWRLIEEGSAAAREDLTAALRRLDSMEQPLEYADLMEGIFSYLAETLPPAEAVRHARSLRDPRKQHYALRLLAETWLASAPIAVGRRVDMGGGGHDYGMGMAASVAQQLSREFSSAPPGAARAWLEAFADHPSRAEIALMYASSYLGENPLQTLELARNFTPWEREKFLRTALPTWVARDPAAAMAWAKSQPEPLPASVQQAMYAAWLRNDPSAVEQQLPNLTDPEERQAAVRAWAEAKTLAGTEAAVRWADSLADPALQEAAHDAIYQATPRGIGVVMFPQDGFPTLMDIIEGSAAAQAGLQKQDRLLEIEGDSGESISLYGKNISEVARELRGEPGSTARLRVLRPGPDGQPTEQTLQIERQQLIMPPERKGEPVPLNPADLPVSPPE